MTFELNLFIDAIKMRNFVFPHLPHATLWLNNRSMVVINSRDMFAPCCVNLNMNLHSWIKMPFPPSLPRSVDNGPPSGRY